MPRRKKGAGLNEHVENYIEEEEDSRPDQKRLDKYRNRYYKAYSEANGIPLEVKKPSGSFVTIERMNSDLGPLILIIETPPTPWGVVSAVIVSTDKNALLFSFAYLVGSCRYIITWGGYKLLLNNC